MAWNAVAHYKYARASPMRLFLMSRGDMNSWCSGKRAGVSFRAPPGCTFFFVLHGGGVFFSARFLVVLLASAAAPVDPCALSPTSSPDLSPSQRTVDPSLPSVPPLLPPSDPPSSAGLALTARVASHRRTRSDQQDLPDLRPPQRRRALPSAPLAARLFFSPLYDDTEARGVPPT